jgi:hypothetical protein
MVLFCLDAHETKTKAFAFTFTASPPRKYCFDKIESAGQPRPSFKRRRPLWDVDGGSSEGKKKRRLRLNLITSRLSRPFSAPATNIVDRGISKIAIWAKGRRLDKNLLRKAAIMNRVRINLDTAKASCATAYAIKQEEVARGTPALRQVIVQKPRCYDAPLPPSPLGLSNYDALDLEDELESFGDWSEEHDDDDGSYCGPSIYSDFNVMKPMTTSDGDDYDYLDELDGIPHDLPDERPPPLPGVDERLVDILTEKERQREISFVQFVA